MKQNYFSIIMPNYNGEQTIKSAINSILSQSYKNFELIIVDDCSTDNSYDIIKSFSKKSKKIRYFKMDKNSGAPVCMNFGVNKAKYEWCAIVDSDATEPIDWLKIANVNSNESIDAFGGNVIYPKPSDKNLLRSVFYLMESGVFSEKEVYYSQNNLIEPCIAGANMFFKKKLFYSIGWFDTSIRAGYDRLFLSKAVENNYKLKFDPKLNINHPLYDFESIKDLLGRTSKFTRWKTLIFKKSNLMEKSYKKLNYLTLLGLFYLITSLYFLGIINTIIISFALIILSYFILSINNLLIFRTSLSIAFYYTFLDILKKAVASTVYLFKLKPKGLDWKKR